MYPLSLTGRTGHRSSSSLSLSHFLPPFRGHPDLTVKKSQVTEAENKKRKKRDLGSVMENGNTSANANLRPWDNNGFYDFGNSSYGNLSCPSSLPVHHPQTQPTQLQHYHLPQRQNHHHLTCLKLGKRPCYREGEEEAPEIHVAKRDKQLPLPPTSLPRCQVEGCNRSLSDAKEYHRRHKVCELHSKAPRVTVQGVEQRFCQQCSRLYYIASNSFLCIN